MTIINQQMSCCFTGHRLIPKSIEDELNERLRNGVEYLYNNFGTRVFYSGGALGFDTLASEAVICCRKKHPDIQLVIVMPCKDQDKKWGIRDKLRYKKIKQAANDIICLSEHYFQGCMQERNRYLVDCSKVCICYLTEQTGGTAYTVKYAEDKGLTIFNLAKKRKEKIQ